MILQDPDSATPRSVANADSAAHALCLSNPGRAGARAVDLYGIIEPSLGIIERINKAIAGRSPDCNVLGLLHALTDSTGEVLVNAT